MYSTDHTAFNEALDDLGAIFAKPVTDELRELYWKALKDQPIGAVMARVQTHKRFGKFFPKPFELRPKDDKPHASGRDDPAFQEAEKRCVAHLEELRKSNPNEWLRVVSPKVYEMGRMRCMHDSEIARKLQEALARP